MKHAGPETLAVLSSLLQQLRGLPGLQERKPGIFYRRGSAVLHFHEDPAGLFADAKLDGREFQRFSVNTDEQQVRLLQAIAQALCS